MCADSLSSGCETNVFLLHASCALGSIAFGAGYAQVHGLFGVKHQLALSAVQVWTA